MAFIAFEGLDGSGKSTLINGLATHLSQHKFFYKVTREPGGTRLGEDIRKLLLNTDGDAPKPLAELFLYCADRAQHVQSFIQPHLEQGYWVLSDRYYASTLAFQCGGRGLDDDLALELSRIAVGGVEPDLWILLDLTVEEARKRQQLREAEGGEPLDRFELEDEAFHSRVREYYLRLSQEQPLKWLVLDASEPPAELMAQVFDEMVRRKWLKS